MRGKGGLKDRSQLKSWFWGISSFENTNRGGGGSEAECEHLVCLRF